MPRLLYLLMACNLVLGTGVFVLAGILVPISESLQVSVAAAGQAMTAYAVSTALLAPLVLVLTGRWPRRLALVFGLLLFALGSLVCALAQSLAVLLAGRVLMGIGAIYTPISGGIAVAMVAPAQRGRALSLVFLGISISYVVGTPLGAWLGFRFGWQWPVGLVAAAGLAAAIALAVLLPQAHRRAGSELQRPAGLARSARDRVDAGRDAALLHCDLPRLLLHRTGAAGAAADVGRMDVVHADAVRPGGRGRHAASADGPTTASVRAAPCRRSSRCWPR